LVGLGVILTAKRRMAGVTPPPAVKNTWWSRGNSNP
jgi:hypothetical protein